jgi:hypothetical protein
LISGNAEDDLTHHLDSPIARQDPRLDLTDVFRGDRGTLMATPKAGDRELLERRGPWEAR